MNSVLYAPLRALVLWCGGRVAERRIGSRKAGRVRGRLFPDVLAFNTKGGGYAPLPWVLRSVQFLFTARAWQLYTYLLMRSGPESVSWQTNEEIAYDLGILPKGLPVYFEQLVELGFVRIAHEAGRRYVCLVDPGTVIEHLSSQNLIPADRVESINDDWDLMGRSPINVADGGSGGGAQ